MNQRVMAIDDSDIAQEFIRAALGDIGFQDVVGFVDPREALTAVESGSIQADLILLDIMMPDIDGIELCARIREVEGWNDVPIIMLSSRKEMDILSQAFMAGANDYVTKPFSRIELQARMRSCLRLKSELDRRRATGNGHRSDRAPGQVVLSTMPALLGSRAGFQANLLALSEAESRAVGLIVMKSVIAGADVPDDENFQRDLHASLGQAFANMHIRASDIFAHWDGDLFCLAVPGATMADLQERARACVAAVAQAEVSVKSGWRRNAVDIVACIVPPGQPSVASALSLGIKAAEDASQAKTPGVVTVDCQTSAVS